MQHLLFLAHRIPFPPTKGDKVRSYHFLRHLLVRYKVHLGAFVDDPADFRHADELRALCTSCHLVPLSRVRARARSALGFFTGQPLTLPYYRSASMRTWVDRTLQEAPIEKIFVFCSAMAQYVRDRGDTCRIADFVDVDSAKWSEYGRTVSWPRSWIYRREGRKLLTYERAVAQAFHATLFVSAAEAGFFRDAAPEAAVKVRHIDNGVDSDFFSPERRYPNPYSAGEQAIVFTGAMDYVPNVEAVSRFAERVFPRVAAAVPTARFWIVGARPTAAVLNLATRDGVRVTGTVPDVRPYLAHAAVAVAPLTIARGVQNKVLEAMAMARPVIASREAATGIQASPGTELIVAEDDESFVTECIRLLVDATTSELGAAARSRVLSTYAWDASHRELDRLLAPCRAAAARDARAQHDGEMTSWATLR